MTKLSIIVPVYNVEDYLNRCIDSILSQTFTDFELILINDGSVDNSKNICEYYANKDSRVKVIHKENGGQSTARNIGLDIASGMYVGFVDSDDWITLDMYEYLINTIEETQSDVVTIELLSTKEDIQLPKHNVDVEVYKDKEIESYFLLNGMKTGSYGVCRYLYKRELWEGIRFPEGKIHEDIEPHYRVLKRANKLIKSSKITYFYYIGDASTTRTGLKAKDFDLLEACKELCEVTKNEDDRNIYYLARVKKARSYFSLLAKIAFYGMDDEFLDRNETIKFLTKNLRENYLLLMKSPMPINRKLMVTAVCIHISLLEKPLKIFKRISNR